MPLLSVFTAMRVDLAVMAASFAAAIALLWGCSDESKQAGASATKAGPSSAGSTPAKGGEDAYSAPADAAQAFTIRQRPEVYLVTAGARSPGVPGSACVMEGANFVCADAAGTPTRTVAETYVAGEGFSIEAPGPLRQTAIRWYEAPGSPFQAAGLGEEFSHWEAVGELPGVQEGQMPSTPGRYILWTNVASGQSSFEYAWYIELR